MSDFLQTYGIDELFYKKTISNFVKDGIAVIYELSKDFEPGCEYPESEVNRRIIAHNDDYCLIRREMVCLGLMKRQAGVYKRTEL